MIAEIMKSLSALKANTLKNNIDIDPVVREMLIVIERVFNESKFMFGSLTNYQFVLTYQLFEIIKIKII